MVFLSNLFDLLMLRFLHLNSLLILLIAEVLSHERIQRFADYRNLVLAAIKKKDLTDGGTPTPSIPKV